MSMPSCTAAMLCLERVSATEFCLPDMCWKEQLNSEMHDSWRCCLFDARSVCFVKAWTRGRWSVLILNSSASSRCLKCLVVRKITNSYLSNVKYFILLLESFFAEES